MINVKNLQFEYKSGLVLGITGFVISLLLGFVSGNSIEVILFRVLIFTILFAFLGYGSFFIIKKYVPEIYQVFSALDNKTEHKSNTGNTDESNEKILTENIPETKEKQETSTESEVKPAQEFTELSNDITPELNVPDADKTLNDEILNSPVEEMNKTAQKLLKDNNIKYEPKIAAQAIRTMMKRDE